MKPRNLNYMPTLLDFLTFDLCLFLHTLNLKMLINFHLILCWLCLSTCKCGHEASSVGSSSSGSNSLLSLGGRVRKILQDTCDKWKEGTLEVSLNYVSISTKQETFQSHSVLPIFKSHHFDHLWVGLLSQVAPAEGDVVHQLIEGGPLILFHFEVRQCVHEVKQSTALLQLLEE